jgi:hypothetical protein
MRTENRVNSAGTGTLVTLSPDAGADLDRRLVVATHRLGVDPHTAPLFSDSAIAGVLDEYPAEWLFALTMGTDPERPEDNERVQHAGASGAELLEAVRRGRLWLNITNIDRVDTRFRALTDRLYAEVAQAVPGFTVDESHATLLVSSPQAMVYFHVDGPPSFLWHVRGRKRVWVYPHLDERVLRRELLEDVYAGTRQEYVPYSTSFDEMAQVRDLEPGDVAMWPHNAPHRVSNLDSLNVSLVTDHWTPDARRRARVYKANRFLRVRTPIPHERLGTAESGPMAITKIALHQLGRRLRLDEPMNKAHRPPRYRIDPTSPSGLSAL